MKTYTPEKKGKMITCNSKSKGFRVSFYIEKKKPAECMGFISDQRSLDKTVIGECNVKNTFHDKEEDIAFPIYKKKPKFHYIAGYQLLDDGSYVAICKRIPMIPFIVILIAAALFLFFMFSKVPNATDKIGQKPLIGNEKTDNTESSTEAPKIVMSCINSYTIDKNHKSIYFKNSPKNTNYCMQYIVSDEKGNVVWDSYEDKGFYVSPGEDSGVNFYAKDYFDAGTHIITVQIRPFRIDTGAECNALTYKMDLTVE